MTRQTAEPLPEYRLSASNRTAREIATSMFTSLDLHPPYQRGSVWTLDQRIALVKSWIMGVQIPAIILNDRATPDWERNEDSRVYEDEAPLWGVVDGKQRIETARLWFDDLLPVPASWFPADRVAQTTETRDGPYVAYGDLTLPGQRHMGHTALLAVIESKLPSLPAEAEMYLLVNGGGTAQTVEDMNNAARIAASATR
jgi:hypothetical protein